MSLCVLIRVFFVNGMIPTLTGKPAKMGEHFPVREFCYDWKSEGMLPKILEKLYWKIKRNTGKVKQICQPVIVKILQIWCHTLNKQESHRAYGTADEAL